MKAFCLCLLSMVTVYYGFPVLSNPKKLLAGIGITYISKKHKSRSHKDCGVMYVMNVKE